MKIVKEDEFDFDEHKNIMDDVFVIPTETVYGLAASVYNEEALKKIFDLKKRPMDNPLIVHVSSFAMLRSLIDGNISQEYFRLIDEYWPGPLSLLFKANKNVSKIVTGNLDTIVIRMPKNNTVLRIIERLKTPIAAPSANISGRPSPTCIEHVISDFGDNVNLYIDGGPCDVGLESTVISCLEDPPVILRPGCITLEQISYILRRQILYQITPTGQESVCPGQKYQHYSPQNRFILIDANGKDITDTVLNLASLNEAHKIGILRHSNVVFDEEKITNVCVYDLGTSNKEICSNLFLGLRDLDSKCDIIFTCSVKSDEEGAAIMDRLERASSKKISL